MWEFVDWSSLLDTIHSLYSIYWTQSLWEVLSRPWEHWPRHRRGASTLPWRTLPSRRCEGRMWPPNCRAQKDPPIHEVQREEGTCPRSHSEFLGDPECVCRFHILCSFFCVKNGFESKVWNVLQSHTWDFSKLMELQRSLLNTFRILVSKNVGSRRDRMDHLGLWFVMKRAHHPRATKSGSGGWCLYCFLVPWSTLSLSDLSLGRFGGRPAGWRGDSELGERGRKRPERQFRVVVTGMGLGGRQAGIPILTLTLELDDFGWAAWALWTCLLICESDGLLQGSGSSGEWHVVPGKQSVLRKGQRLPPLPGWAKKVPRSLLPVHSFTLGHPPPPHTHTQTPSVGRCCLVDGFVRCLEFQITMSREPGPLTPEARGKGASHSGDCQGL